MINEEAWVHFYCAAFAAFTNRNGIGFEEEAGKSADKALEQYKARKKKHFFEEEEGGYRK